VSGTRLRLGGNLTRTGPSSSTTSRLYCLKWMLVLRYHERHLRCICWSLRCFRCRCGSSLRKLCELRLRLRWRITTRASCNSQLNPASLTLALCCSVMQTELRLSCDFNCWDLHFSIQCTSKNPASGIKLVEWRDYRQFWVAKFLISSSRAWF